MQMKEEDLIKRDLERDIWQETLEAVKGLKGSDADSHAKSADDKSMVKARDSEFAPGFAVLTAEKSLSQDWLNND